MLLEELPPADTSGAAAAFFGVEQPVVRSKYRISLFNKFSCLSRQILKPEYINALLAPPSQPPRPSEQLLWNFWRYAEVPADDFGNQLHVCRVGLDALEAVEFAERIPRRKKASSVTPPGTLVKQSYRYRRTLQDAILTSGYNSLLEMVTKLACKARVSL